MVPEPPAGVRGRNYRQAEPATGVGRRRLVAGLMLVLAAMAVAPPPGASAATPRAATLGKADRADIGRIEAYLNRIGTLKARFLQVSSRGELAEGDLYIARPGRLRIEYDPPVPILIVAAGGYLTYYDRDLEQVNQVDVDSTPAGILVGEKISFFAPEIMVTGFERRADSLRVTLVRTEDPLDGSLTLVFSDRPLTLRKWTVTDAQGIETTVSLLKTRFGLPLNPKLFRFQAPEDLGPEH